MVKVTNFSSMPEPSLQGLDFSLYEILTAMKQNIELLTGQRNELDGGSRAITTAAITVAEPGTPQFLSTAAGVGITINGMRVPSYDDYINLLTDVRNLGKDVEELRALMSTLITQLRN
jgi:hypothetical protein